MTAILTRCKVTSAAVAAGEGSPAEPATDYYFLSTYGVYVGDIAEATGVTAETADTDYSDFPLTPVKSLLRAGVMSTERVTVTDGSGNKYLKTLHVADTKSATFDAAIIDKVWPVGKGTGGTIESTNVRLRVVSRR